MPERLSLTESLYPVSVLAPAADAGGRTGTWVNLAFSHKAYLVVFVNQGNAATILLSLLQATSAAGAGSKAAGTLGNAQIWATLDAAGAPVFVRQTDGVTFTTDAGVKVKIVVFQMDPTDVLDLANGFTYVTVSTGASNSGNITSALLLQNLRFAGVAPPNLLT